uniref:Small ribosomal subunit protein uS15 N-terminal domain-containing protein n=1 Tax=Nelumbo nucifera TaxID=4432 RepID=A0A822ZD78_NELNU|nr:TPA_asm: hypothetical protein HUJ06_001312 [Nelumbo nucifera]
MHSRGKGIFSSALPYKRTPSSWLKISSQDVEENIYKFAKKGLTSSQIGVILRDSHGVTRSCVSLRLMGLLLKFLRICTTSLRRLLQSKSILKGTGRTRIPSSD